MAGMIPVVLCGKTTQIAVGVIANLKPEFDGTLHIRNPTTDDSLTWSV
jgi:hypothetical protein